MHVVALCRTQVDECARQLQAAAVRKDAEAGMVTALECQATFTAFSTHSKNMLDAAKNEVDEMYKLINEIKETQK